MKRDTARVLAAVALLAAAGVAFARIMQASSSIATSSSLDELLGPEGTRAAEGAARDVIDDRGSACPWPDGRPRHIGAIEYTLRCG